MTRQRRVELDGLRGLAVLLVVCFHVFGQGRVSGGVDVFFVLTGFFSTASLLALGASPRFRMRGRALTREIAAWWGRHLGGLVARLFPALVTVLIGVLLVGGVVLPPLRMVGLWGEAVTSLAHVQNIALAANTGGYAQADRGVSPLQHLWSLSVQLQVMLGLPVVVGVAWLLRRSTRVRARMSAGTTVALVLAAAAVPSFVFAATLAATDPASAYYATFARVWEFAVGGLLAALPLARGGRVVRAVAATVGVVLLVTCGFVLDGAQLFPGPAALWPVGAAALVVWGTASGAGPASALLRGRPFLWFGGVSYALYLVHWPVLVLFLEAFERDRVGYLTGPAVVLASVLVAWPLTRLTERATRTLRPQRTPAARDASAPTPRRRLAVATALTLAAVALLAGQARINEQRAYWAQAAPTVADIGAAAVDDPDVPTVTARVLGAFPNPLYIEGRSTATALDLGDCATKLGQVEVTACSFGDDAGAERVVLVGDSHSAHWFPALRAVAETRHYALTTLVKQGCRWQHPQVARDDPSVPDDCAEWNRQVEATLDELEPDVIVTVGTRTFDDGTPEQVGSGESTWWTAVGQGRQVLLIRDTPRFAQHVPECLTERGATSIGCGRPQAEVMAAVDPLQDTDILADANVAELDLTRWFCVDGVCPAVIGNVVVYRDAHHVTDAYAASLAPRFLAALDGLTGRTD